MHDNFISIGTSSAETEPYHLEYVFGDLNKVTSTEMAKLYIKGHAVYLKNLETQRNTGKELGVQTSTEIDMLDLAMSRVMFNAAMYVHGEYTDKKMKELLIPFEEGHQELIQESLENVLN